MVQNKVAVFMDHGEHVMLQPRCRDSSMLLPGVKWPVCLSVHPTLSVPRLLATTMLLLPLLATDWQVFRMKLSLYCLLYYTAASRHLPVVSQLLIYLCRRITGFARPSVDFSVCTSSGIFPKGTPLYLGNNRKTKGVEKPKSVQTFHSASVTDVFKMSKMKITGHDKPHLMTHKRAVTM